MNQIFRDVRAFTLHFRNELYTAQIGRVVMNKEFVVKADECCSTPHDQEQSTTGAEPQRNQCGWSRPSLAQGRDSGILHSVFAR